jgi:signal transduction histidine kinase
MMRPTDTNMPGLAATAGPGSPRAKGSFGTAMWLAWSSCAIAVALVLAAAVIGFLTRSYTPAGELPQTIPVLLYLPAFLAFPIVGAIIVSRRPAHPIGWIFSAAGALGAAGLFADGYWRYVLVVHPGALPFGVLMLWVTRWVYPLNFGLVLLALLLFPTGRLPAPRWRILAGLGIIGIILNVASQAFKPGPMVGDVPVENPFGFGRAAGLLDLLETGSLGLIMLSLVAVAGSIIVRLRRARGVERQQIKWLAYAAGLMAVSFVVSFTPQPEIARAGFSVGVLGWGLIPISTGLAILRYRLWEIDPIINRTLVYGALTASIIVIYVLVVGYLGTLFNARGNLAISLIATGLVAVLFQPLRAYLQRAVNRLMYGERDDPYAVLSRLGQRFEATLAAEAVLPTLVETVQEALKLPYVAVALKQADGFVVGAEAGAPVDNPLLLPLVYQNEQMGQLVLGPRSPGEVFSSADRRLLDDLARQAGIAVHGVRLTADVQLSRERLVTAREEERRRLRRDLHDGLGPTLASLIMKVDTAQTLVLQDPQTGVALLAEVQAQMKATINNVRRLVYGLRPPVLDQFGLLGAIREHALHIAQPDGPVVEIDAPEPYPGALRGLPAAVEVAAYYIVVEALTNVVRHAHAQHCSVRLKLDRSLSLEIVDDGRGLPAQLQAGVGFQSMRERAAELGGICIVEGMQPHGTRVQAQLPLP